MKKTVIQLEKVEILPEHMFAVTAQLMSMVWLLERIWAASTTYAQCKHVNAGCIFTHTMHGL